MHFDVGTCVRYSTPKCSPTSSQDQFPNGKIKRAIPTAIWQMRSAHESMTEQEMADSRTMHQFGELITRMVYEVVMEGARGTSYALFIKASFVRILTP